MPKMLAHMAENDRPQTADCTPNQPDAGDRQQQGNDILRALLPSEPPAMTEVGRPRSLPCMPMKHM